MANFRQFNASHHHRACTKPDSMSQLDLWNDDFQNEVYVGSASLLDNSVDLLHSVHMDAN